MCSALLLGDACCVLHRVSMHVARMLLQVRARVCVCVRARARVRVCVRARAYTHVSERAYVSSVIVPACVRVCLRA